MSERVLDPANPSESLYIEQVQGETDPDRELLNMRDMLANVVTNEQLLAGLKPFADEEGWFKLDMPTGEGNHVAIFTLQPGVIRVTENEKSDYYILENVREIGLSRYSLGEKEKRLLDLGRLIPGEKNEDARQASKPSHDSQVFVDAARSSIKDSFHNRNSGPGMPQALEEKFMNNPKIVSMFTGLTETHLREALTNHWTNTVDNVLGKS